MRPTFETKMLIYQSKDNLDEKILVRKITYLQGSTIRKMSLRGLCRNWGFNIPFWPMIYEALKFMLSVSEIESQHQ